MQVSHPDLGGMHSDECFPQGCACARGTEHRRQLSECVCVSVQTLQNSATCLQYLRNPRTGCVCSRIKMKCHKLCTRGGADPLFMGSMADELCLPIPLITKVISELQTRQAKSDSYHTVVAVSTLGPNSAVFSQELCVPFSTRGCSPCVRRQSGTTVFRISNSQPEG